MTNPELTSELIPIGNVEGVSPQEMREKIVALEAAMKAMPAERHLHIEPKHYFANGLYMREITIPKGATITGKIHKTEHLCVLSRGEVSVQTEDGIKRIQASTVVHSKPGMKRVLFAHEESVWINCHHNPENETDLDKIEAFYVVDTFDQFLAFTESVKQIEGGK